MLVTTRKNIEKNRHKKCYLLLFTMYDYKNNYTVDSGNSKRLNSEQSLISEHFW